MTMPAECRAVRTVIGGERLHRAQLYRLRRPNDPPVNTSWDHPTWEAS